MSLWDRLWKKKPEQRAITYQIGLNSGLIDTPTRSGVHVTETTALGVSAVWCAINVIAQAVGSLPCEILDATTGEEVEGHPLRNVLKREPNPEMTAPVFWETVTAHVLLWGNGICEIERDGRGRPVALWPISPQFVQLLRDSESGELVYRVILPFNQVGEPSQTGKVVTFSQNDIWHVPGLGDGVYGHQLLTLARENIAYSVACDRWGQAYFGNACRPSGVLTTETTLSDQARDNVGKSWKNAYQGTDNVGKVAFLEEGLKFTPLNFTNEAGQYAETRKFQISEVCRLFNISPAKLHNLDGTSQYGTLPAMYQDFYSTTLRPWLEKFEAESERKLLLPGERDALDIEFDTCQLLRADELSRTQAMLTRYQAYSLGVAGGWIDPETVADLEELPKPKPKPKPKPVQVQPAAVQPAAVQEQDQQQGGNPDDQ